MFDRDLWFEIFFSIKSNKLRTFLTGFSVAWGIFILVMLLASVKGMENGFRKEMMRSASNSIFITPSYTKKAYKGFEVGRRIKFTNEDINFVKQSFTNEVEYLAPVYRNHVSAKYKNEVGGYHIVGTDVNYEKIEQLNILEGRVLSTSDVEENRKVVLLGEKIKKDLFGDDSPIGKDLVLNNSFFKVIGVFKDEGNSRGEELFICPYTTLQKMNKSTNYISSIVLTYNPNYNLIQAQSFSNYLKQIFQVRHKIHPEDNAVYVDDRIRSYTEMTSFVKLLQIISLFVGMLILISGIIGIGNILVVIIKERTKEIGVRKALGAKPSQVVSLVLLESVFITTISGLVGVALAMLIVNSIGPMIDSPAFRNPHVDISIVFIALIILVCSGILAGLIPAIRAAKVRPIVALREY